MRFPKTQGPLGQAGAEFRLTLMPLHAATKLMAVLGFG